MESFHNPLQKDYQVSALNLDFEKLKSDIDGEAIKSKRVEKYGLKTLKKINTSSNRINREIELYNSGNTAQKKSIIAKIEYILYGQISRESYPLSEKKMALLSLEGFFDPIRVSCERIISELNRESRIAKEKKITLEREKNSLLCGFMQNEQSMVCEHPEILKSFFSSLKKKFAKHNAPPSVYMAYAWPSENHIDAESWVQNFLKQLKAHLVEAGIQEIKLDVITNFTGNSINKYMKNLESDSFVLLFGTESLYEKIDQGTSAVCTEMVHILRKREEDVKKGRIGVFPILLSGSVRTSFPPEYERFSTVCDWRYGGYMKRLQDLYLQLFGFSPEKWNEKLKKRWEGIPNREELDCLGRRYNEQREKVKIAKQIEELASIPIQLSMLEDVSMQKKPIKNLLVTRLKEHYLSINKISVFSMNKEGKLEIEFDINSLYTHLAMISGKEANQTLQGKGSAQEVKSQNDEKSQKSKIEILPENVFSQEKLQSASRKRVLFSGAAGIGKSTFVKYVTHAWAENKLWQDFEAVFCIRLRRLFENIYPIDRERAYTPKDFLQSEHKALHLDFDELLKDDAFLNKSLLILDGYDELPNAAGSKGGHLYEAFEELKKLFPHILVTSRPGSVNFESTCTFEILGFNNEQIKSYARAFFQQIGDKNNKNYEKLDSYLQRVPLVANLSQIPINLTIICLLMNEGLLSEKDSLTLIDLYEKIINQFYKVFLIKEGEQLTFVQGLNRPDLNSKVTRLASSLMKLAYYASENGTLLIEEDKIEEIAAAENIEYSKLKRLGPFKIGGGSGEFIHKTFQEYYSAQDITKFYLENNGLEAISILRKHKFNPNFSLIWPMVAGLIDKRGTLPNLQEFFDDLFDEPKDLAIRCELNLLASCFEECSKREEINQYSSFIKVCKKYIKTIPSDEIVFELLGKNRTLLNHAEIIDIIIKMLYSNSMFVNASFLSLIVESGQKIHKKIDSTVREILKEREINGTSKEFYDDTSFYLRTVIQDRPIPVSTPVTIFKLPIPPLPLIANEEASIKALGNLAKKGEIPEGGLLALVQKLDSFDTNPNDYAHIVTSLKEIVVNSDKPVDDEILDQLIQTLKAKKCKLKRHSVIESLGFIAIVDKTHSQRILDVLIEILEDLEIRDDACDVLKKMVRCRVVFPPEIFNKLFTLLKEDRNPELVADLLTEVVYCQENLPENIVGTLNEFLESNTSDKGEARASAIDAMGYLIESGKTVSCRTEHVLMEILLNHFREDDFSVKFAATDALKELIKKGVKLPQDDLELLSDFFEEMYLVHYGNHGTYYMTVELIASIFSEIVRSRQEIPKNSVNKIISFLDYDYIYKSDEYSAFKIFGELATNGMYMPSETLDMLFRFFKNSYEYEGANDTLAEALEQIAMSKNIFPEKVINGLIEILNSSDGDLVHTKVIKILWKIFCNNEIHQFRPTLEELLVFSFHSGNILVQEGDDYRILDLNGVNPDILFKIKKEELNSELSKNLLNLRESLNDSTK